MSQLNDPLDSNQSIAPQIGADSASLDNQCCGDRFVNHELRRGHAPTEEERLSFKKGLTSDLESLERLVFAQKLDTSSKIGAELEYVLIDGTGRPAPSAAVIINEDAQYQRELSLCNVEITTEPTRIEGSFLMNLEHELSRKHEKILADSAAHDVDPLLIGVLPTYRPSDFNENWFGSERYLNLNAALLAKGDRDQFTLKFSGTDQVHASFPTILAQSLNTSFQIHLSAAPERLTLLYNISQLVAGPLLSCTGNSSLVLGNRAWSESRIPIWHQSTDCGGYSSQHVFFGDDWIRDPLAPLQDLRHIDPLVMPANQETSPNSSAPPLSYLRTGNGTTWRWNRLCYGVSPQGIPHLRIEVRYLPAGPTISDMVANAAYFYGLVHGLENLIVSGALPPLERSALSFSQVKENFESAARLGLESQLTWLDGKRWRAVELNLKLIEIAESGLMSLGVPEEQRERYLGVIRERVVSGKTGAQWQLKAFENLRGRFSDEECLAKIACRVFELQNYRDDSDRSLPVARWPDLT